MKPHSSLVIIRAIYDKTEKYTYTIPTTISYISLSAMLKTLILIYYVYTTY